MLEKNINVLDTSEEITRDVLRCRNYLRAAGKGILKSFPNLKTFCEADHAGEIRGMSHGMSLTEICDFYGITEDSLEEPDKLFFYTQFLKGRVTGVHKATNELFSQMGSRNGVQASLAYLERFSDGWEGVSESASKLRDGVPKALRIELIE